MKSKSPPFGKPLILGVALSLTSLLCPLMGSTEAWEFSYQGDRLPEEIEESAWRLVTGNDSEGHGISVVDGALRITLKSDSAAGYYRTYAKGRKQTWYGGAGKSEVRFRARVVEPSDGAPWVGMFGFGGLGEDKLKTALVYLGKDSILAFNSIKVPLDTSVYHDFRLEIGDGVASLFIDNEPKPVAVIRLEDIPNDEVPNEAVLFGGTFGRTFQGSMDVAELRWVNHDAPATAQDR